MLANERTFLAWARTGLGFVGAGLGYFYTNEHVIDAKNSLDMDVIGATTLLVGNGLVFLSFATYRYFETCKHLRKGRFPMAYHGIVGIIASTAVSTLCSLYLIVKKRLRRPEGLD